jgi:DNA mismatch repair protein MutL
VQEQAAATLATIAEALGKTGTADQRWHDLLLATLACHAAVRAGQSLSHEEMRALVDDLGRCRMPRTCPHGRPTAILLSAAQLQRQFGRA